MTVDLPAPIVVTRHQCPHCRRYTRAKRERVEEHMPRCWQNPVARGCKTCQHFDQDPGGEPCFPGRPCDCNDPFEQCSLGEDITNGPIINCPHWEART